MDIRKLSKKEKAIHREAEEALSGGISASEFSQRFFGPEGKLNSLGDAHEARRAVAASALYRWLEEAMTRLRSVEVSKFERDSRQLSGRLTVQVPRSLHAALKDEAVSEGVSLAELIRLKLGIPYSLTVRSIAGATRKRA